MNYIQKLLNGEKVEWKTLGEVCNFRNGFAFKSNKFKEEGEAILRIGNIQNQNIELSDLKYFDKSEYKENLKPFEIKKGDILVAMSGATTGKVGMLKTEGVFYLNQRVGKFEPIKEALNNNYLYHYLLSQTNQLYILAGGGAQPNLSSTALMEKIQIPIPPLPVQQKIAEILDRFAELEAELEAELHLREKQYAYYRNYLLTPNEQGLLNGKKVEWKTLDKISENLNNLRKPVKGGEREKGDIPYYGASGIVDYVKDYIFDDDLLLISEDGANLLARNTPIAFSVTGKCWVNNHAHILKFKTYCERKYIEYYLNDLDLTPYITGAAQPKLNKQNLNSIKIPIPPMEEQERIVKILDKFDTLVNSISEGLPKEIALRRKQYEYYREQLLSF